MEQMRLQKFLAQAGIASRRKAEKLIEQGLVSVNGQEITKLGTTIDPEKDIVEYKGKEVFLETEKIYIAINKPSGIISSASSAQGKSVIDLVKVKQRVYPVGRLDKDSTGLMILTNDGEFANQVIHPRFGSEKEYFVILDQDLKPEDIKKLEKGMKLGDKKISGIKVISAKNKSARLILNEGVNRQIRRMLGKLGYTVRKLKRIRIGKLEIKDLAEGKTKNIKPQDVL